MQKNISLKNSLQWPIDKINTVYKTKLSWKTSSWHLHVLMGESTVIWSMGIINSDIVGLKGKGKKRK